MQAGGPGSSVRLGMTGNQLKVLALVAMTLDHIGVVLLPQVAALRAVGRLAFPIFAYMVAEGCFFTRSRARYLGGICALGAVCQAVFFAADGSLEQSILTTFALGICVVYALQLLERRRDALGMLVLVGVLAADAFACFGVPALLRGTGFSIDYGYAGTLLPALCYLPRLGQTRDEARAEKPAAARRRRRFTLALAAAGLVAVALGMPAFPVQWWSLAALVVLALYDGRRGTLRMKYLFYVYYPLHLAVIGGIGMLLG